MPRWTKISFQERNSPTIEHLSIFHDHSIIILIIITISTFYLLSSIIKRKLLNITFIENQEIEIFWTLIPIFILIFIIYPSIKILYIIEENISPSITIKIKGHQWYWSYEYSNLKDLSIDAFITKKIPRLLICNNNLILPTKIPTRLITTSEDVIHSWTVPSLGIKADAVPGRINQIITEITRSGKLTGQCREICGSNHRFIPISITRTNPKTFINSLKNISLNGWLKHWPLKPTIVKTFNEIS